MCTTSIRATTISPNFVVMARDCGASIIVSSQIDYWDSESEMMTATSGLACFKVSGSSNIDYTGDDPGLCG